MHRPVSGVRATRSAYRVDRVVQGWNDSAEDYLRAGIEGGTFRANSLYELTPLDDVGGHDNDICGWLRRRTPPGGKPVDRFIARVFTDLAEPGSLPAYASDRPCSRFLVAALVLDEVLEIESGESFVSGPAACPLIFTTVPDPAPQNVLARLSLEAVQHGDRLGMDDAARLAARLYFYNRVPVTADWARTLPSPDAVASYLRLFSNSALASLLQHNWIMTSGGAAGVGWLTWTSRCTLNGGQQHRSTFKLYVSPACERMQDAFHTAVEASTHCGAVGFKVGSDAYGLLRPDKLVVYFANLDRLNEAADRIRRSLEGCPAHGVPFTADLGGGGLLSWGIDPPPAWPELPWEDRGSWRLWVAGHLAAALVTGRGHGEIPAWRFALARLAVAGVDPHTWRPTRGVGDISSAQGDGA